MYGFSACRTIITYPHSISHFLVKKYCFNGLTTRRKVFTFHKNKYFLQIKNYFLHFLLKFHNFNVLGLGVRAGLEALKFNRRTALEPCPKLS